MDPSGLRNAGPDGGGGWVDVNVLDKNEKKEEGNNDCPCPPKDSGGFMDGVQGALEVGGMAPGVGIVPDY